MESKTLKHQVKEYWEREVCGSRFGDSLADRRRYFAEIDQDRYVQDYMLPSFASFDQYRGQRVLEIGLGTGADFIRWARAGALASGRDLTEASVAMVKERLELEALDADVALGDAERLEFPDECFDLFYSWGVLHHTPDTARAIAEAHRVLKPGGTLKIMLYHYPSVGAWLVWLAHGPMRCKWIGPRQAVYQNVESPGTKMYSRRQARDLVGRIFKTEAVITRTYLGSGDLLSQKRLSRRYQGRWWKLARAVYPAWFVRRVLGDGFGTVLTIQATKPRA